MVIGAPYKVDKKLLDHFNVDLVCHGSTEIELDSFGNDPYKTPKELDMFKIVLSGNVMNAEKIMDRIIQNR